MKKRRIITLIPAGLSSILVIAVIGTVIYELACVKMLYKNSFRLMDENYDCVYSVFGDKILEKDEYIARQKSTYDRIPSFVIPFNLTGLFNLSGGEYKPDKKVILLNATPGGFLNNDNNYEVYNAYLHELKHADDQDPLIFAEGVDSTAKDIFIEGAASFWAYQSSTRNFVQDAWSNYETDGSYEMEVGSNNFTYGSFVYQYTLFLTLTDYDTICRYTQSGGDSKIIKTAIKSKYGIDSSHFWELAKACPAVRTSDYIIEQAEIFLNSCLIQDVESISSRDEALRMLNLYRFLKINTIPRCYKDNVYCTGDYIDIDTVETALFEKIAEYDLLDELTADTDEQRFIYDCLLYMPDKDDDVDIDADGHYFDVMRFPKSITLINMTFNADTMTLQMTDVDNGMPFAQFVNGGLYETVDIDSGFNIPLEPVTGTSMTFG